MFILCDKALINIVGGKAASLSCGGNAQQLVVDAATFQPVNAGASEGGTSIGIFTPGVTMSVEIGANIDFGCSSGNF